MIKELALHQTLLRIKSMDPLIFQDAVQEKISQYKNEFLSVRNVTVLEREPGVHWHHNFDNVRYQQALREIIHKYQTEQHARSS